MLLLVIRCLSNDCTIFFTIAYNNCVTSITHDKVRMAVDHNAAANAASMATDAHNKFRPYVHDIISCLAVGGNWITSQADLQVFYHKFVNFHYVLTIIMLEYCI